MILTDPALFERAAQELLRHASHKIGLMPIGGDAAPESLIIECEGCHEVLIEFLPEPQTERPDPERVKYEGHYEQAIDLCHVEVIKPGKSPYPMQERQDLINHSPTGIAWGLWRVWSCPMCVCHIDGLLGRRGTRTRTLSGLQIFDDCSITAQPGVVSNRSADRAGNHKN